MTARWTVTPSRPRDPSRTHSLSRTTSEEDKDPKLDADLERVLITPEQIGVRIAELASQVDADYAGRDLLLVGVLKGAVMVMADLCRALTRG